MPDSYIDRRHRPTIRTALPGQVATLGGAGGAPGSAGEFARHPWRVLVTDGTGFMELTYWGKAPPRVLVTGCRSTRVGQARSASADRLCMPKPDHVASGSGRVAVAGSGACVAADGWVVRLARCAAAMREALRLVPELPEWHDPNADAAGRLAVVSRGAAGRAMAGRPATGSAAAAAVGVRRTAGTPARHRVGPHAGAAPARAGAGGRRATSGGGATAASATRLTP